MGFSKFFDLSLKIFFRVEPENEYYSVPCYGSIVYSLSLESQLREKERERESQYSHPSKIDFSDFYVEV